MKNKILQGDTLKVLKKLPDAFIDMGVTSPPYNKKINTDGSIFRSIKYDKVQDDLPEDEYQQNQINVLDELYRTIKPGGSFFYNHKVRHLKGIATFPLEWLVKSKWHIRQEIIWDKHTCTEWGGYRFHQKDERIYWLYKPIGGKVIGVKLEGKHAVCSSIWNFTPDMDNPHPAPFPVILPLRCILSFMSDRKGLIIDPYMGSGTTGIACRLLGHDYMGIDISSNYIKSATDRISNFKDHIDVLKQELLIHVVKNSYKDRQKKKKERDLKKKTVINSFFN